jgi:hypothetical protein
VTPPPPQAPWTPFHEGNEAAWGRTDAGASPAWLPIYFWQRGRTGALSHTTSWPWAPVLWRLLSSGGSCPLEAVGAWPSLSAHCTWLTPLLILSFILLSHPRQGDRYYTDKDEESRLGVVPHACNPSYSGSLDRRITVQASPAI